MSNSPLVTRNWPADPSNYTKGRTQKLRGIVIHHAASTSLNSIGATFANPNRNGSAHYGVGGKEVHQYVDEANTAWHCSNWNGNCRTIGIEITNSTGAPDWKVSDETMGTVIKLMADIAKRNGFGKLTYQPDGDGTGVTGHKDWQGAKTACPGPYLYPKLAWMCEQANLINYPPKPTFEWVDTEPTTMVVKAGGANLIDLTTKNVIKTFRAGDEFTYVQKTSDDKYVRTEYSKEKNLNNGVLLSDLEPIPTPEPEPTPEPTPEPDPTPEPEPTPNWFIDFIHKLGEFFINLFTGREK